MTRSLNVLGLTLVAVLAMSAALAGGALAVDHTFEATSSPVKLTGNDDEGIHRLHFGEFQIECVTTTLNGESAKTSEDKLTLSPEFNDCTIGSGSIGITNEGCSFVFDSDTTSDPNTGGESGTVEIVCAAGKLLRLTFPGCTMDFDTQGPLHGITYSNAGDTAAGHEDITLGLHIFGMEYNATNNGCGLFGVTKGIHKDGTYIGNSTVRAYQPGKEHTTENQVGLRMTTP